MLLTQMVAASSFGKALARAAQPSARGKKMHTILKEAPFTIVRPEGPGNAWFHALFHVPYCCGTSCIPKGSWKVVL